MNPSEGRVPVSWNECADWLEAFGPEYVQYNNVGRWEPTGNTAEMFTGPLMGVLEFADYRLLPPPGLVAAPEGMDGGGWLGQGKDVPDGWEWRPYMDSGWHEISYPHPGEFVQCRPPVPKREPEWVPLTKLVGRTIEGCDVPVHAYEETARYAMRWWAPHDLAMDHRPFPDGTLDLDTGRVKVEPEEEQ